MRFDRQRSCHRCLWMASALVAFLILAQPCFAAEFEADVRPFLVKYCANCHTGEDAEGEFDYSRIKSASQVTEAYENWKAMAGHLQSETMPPDDEPQPTKQERELVLTWYRHFITTAKPRPAIFRARRLSVTEFRNSLRSVLGFDLELAVVEAEQTLAQRSLVVKLLPDDPPGASGFINDTHANPLTVLIWDQYGTLIDTGLEDLFSFRRRTELEALAGPLSGKHLDAQQANALVDRFTVKAWRRPVSAEELSRIRDRFAGLQSERLTAAVKLELKAILMSPSFTHRGIRMPLEPGKRQQVDSYELAERLSYFLWADMPDDELFARAASGQLRDPVILAAEVDRMLASPKARSLADVFGEEWFTLKEIEGLNNNPPFMIALKSQPLDFLHFLFTQNRPLLELIDSDVAFVNPFMAKHYGPDAKQMKRYAKQRGIEVEIVPNQKIELRKTKVRGGILTIPGVLAMNKGPITRGTWVLERVLGEHLPDPPANVGQVAGNKRGENLSFRERFELHRSRPSCAACHNKIDPIGFALEGFNGGGAYVKKKDANIQTGGQLPTGETFSGIEELKKVLVTSRRDTVLRNIVRRTMAYALCRELTLYDHATVESLVERMSETNGAWRDLFVAIAQTPQFQETIASATKQSKE